MTAAELERGEPIGPAVQSGWTNRHSPDGPTVRIVHVFDFDERTNMREGRHVEALVRSDFIVGAPLTHALPAADRRAVHWIDYLGVSQEEVGVARAR